MIREEVEKIARAQVMKSLVSEKYGFYSLYHLEGSRQENGIVPLSQKNWAACMWR